MLHDDLLQEHLPQASHFFHLLMFSALLAMGHCLCSNNHHENNWPNKKPYYDPLWTHHKLHSKHCGFLWDFFCINFDLNVWALIWNSHSSRHTCRLHFFNKLQSELAALAQMVACLPLVQQVRGSIPGRVVNFNLKIFNLGAGRGRDVHFLIARLYNTGLD